MRMFAAALFSFFTLLPAPVLASGFPDLPADSTLSGPILRLSAMGVIQGNPDGTFQPRRTVTLGEWLKLLSVAEAAANHDSGAQQDLSARTTASFVSDASYIPAGVVRSADTPLTRLQAALILADRYDLDDGSVEPPFTDVPAEHENILSGLWAAGVVSGETPLLFGSDHPLLRQEAAKLLEQAVAASLRQGGTIRVSDQGLRLLDVSNMSLAPGESTTVLVGASSSGGDPAGGYDEEDFVVHVVRGNLEYVGMTELGTGVYAFHFRAGSVPGAIQIQITLVAAATNPTITVGGGDTATSAVGVRAMPTSVNAGGEVSIISVPRTPDNDPVSGLDLKLSIVEGGAEVVEQMTESPAGSGIYVGRILAGTPGTVRARVTITDIVTRPSGDAVFTVY